MSNNEKMIELSKQEEKDWQSYLHIYSIKNPIPKKSSIINWKLGLVMIGAVGAVAFSAFRNSGAFFMMATRAGVPSWAITGEAVSGVAAVNILLVSLSILLSYKRRNVSDLSLYVGTGIVLLIGSLIGLSQSFSGVGQSGLVEGINFLLAISVGVGVTVLEWLGGDMIGVELVRYEESSKQREQTYQTELRTWEANARHGFGAWLANKERKLSKQIEQTNVPAHRTTNQQTRLQTNPRTSNSEQTIVRLLDTVYSNEQRLLGVTELSKLVANEQGITNPDDERLFVDRKKGYVSQVRTRWIAQKGI